MVMTEPGEWLLREYAKTPGDPKWYPGTGLESTIYAIEVYAASEERDKIRLAVEALGAQNGGECPLCFTILDTGDGHNEGCPVHE